MSREALSAVVWTAGLAAVAAASILLADGRSGAVPFLEASSGSARVGDVAESRAPAEPGAAEVPSGSARSASPALGPGLEPGEAAVLPEFVEIPSGSFRMGSDPAENPLAYDNERWGADGAPGTLDLPAYYIGRSEVTVEQYRAFAEATGHPVVDSAALAGPPDHPVRFVSWTDALAYGRWLEGVLKESADAPQEVRGAVRDGWRVTLPSEAEWEKAARGTDGRIFPWGDEPDRQYANYSSNGPAPVGSHPCGACPFGLSDMSGNVWEWTRSPYQPYPFDPTDDRRDLESDALWVMRGGAFNDGARNVRAAVRGGADPGVRRPFIGFRVALTRF